MVYNYQNMINEIKRQLEFYAPFVLRVGMAMVILWFSLEQFTHNGSWVAYIPDYAVSISHLSASSLVSLNALFELIFGMMILFGFYTRLSAFLLAIHLFDIMLVVGYGEIGARDFGLAIGTFVVFMNGPDIFCIQQKIDTKTLENINKIEIINKIN